MSWLRLAFWCSLLSLVARAEADAGARELGIQLPAPPGFARLSPEMTLLWSLSEKTVPSTNVQLAMFISETDVPDALAGKPQNLTRRFHVQMSKQFLVHSMSRAQLSEFKAGMKQGLLKSAAEGAESIKKYIPVGEARLNKALSEELNADTLLKIGGIVPLTPHAETDESVSWSMFATVNFSNRGGSVTQVVAATQSLVWVNGKMLILIVYGGQNDLDWTRQQSKDWIGAIELANRLSPPETASPLHPSSINSNWFSAKLLKLLFWGGVLGALAMVRRLTRRR